MCTRTTPTFQLCIGNLLWHVNANWVVLGWHWCGIVVTRKFKQYWTQIQKHELLAVVVWWQKHLYDPSSNRHKYCQFLPECNYMDTAPILTFIFKPNSIQFHLYVTSLPWWPIGTYQSQHTHIIRHMYSSITVTSENWLRGVIWIIRQGKKVFVFSLIWLFNTSSPAVALLIQHCPDTNAIGYCTALMSALLGEALGALLCLYVLGLFPSLSTCWITYPFDVLAPHVLQIKHWGGTEWNPWKKMGGCIFLKIVSNTRKFSA